MRHRKAIFVFVARPFELKVFYLKFQQEKKKKDFVFQRFFLRKEIVFDEFDNGSLVFIFLTFL